MLCQQCMPSFYIIIHSLFHLNLIGKKRKKIHYFDWSFTKLQTIITFLRIDIFWMVSYWERRLKCKKPIFQFDAATLEYFKLLQQNFNTKTNFKLLKLQITLNLCLKKDRSFQKEGKFRSFSSLHVKSRRCEPQQFEPIGGKQWRLEPKPYCKVQKNLWGFAYTKRPLQIQR